MTREELIEAIARAMAECEPRSLYGDAVAALAALEAAGAVVVPREATHEMADVGTEARWKSAVRDANNVREIWRAMIAASPYAPPRG